MTLEPEFFVYIVLIMLALGMFRKRDVQETDDEMLDNMDVSDVWTD